MSAVRGFARRGRPIAAFAVSLAIGSAYAQVNTGTKLGSVTDPTGAAVPRVTIGAVNTLTGYARSIVSGADGSYLILSLPVSDGYQISAEAPGSKSFVRTGITLQVGQNARIDIELQRAMSQKRSQSRRRRRWSIPAPLPGAKCWSAGTSMGRRPSLGSGPAAARISVEEPCEPDPVSLVVKRGDPREAWRRTTGVSFEASAAAGTVIHSTQGRLPEVLRPQASRVPVRFVPFCKVTRGKYSIWFPAVVKS